MTTDNVPEEQMTEGESQVEESTAAPRPTPGRLLAAQREALDMTVHQVAETLNLTRHFIRSLEEDRYDKLPDEVFVRGYIRSYSKLVNLDPAQLLELYEEFTTKKQVRKEEAIKRHARRRRDKNQPWILVSGVAFIAVAATLWLLGSGGSDEPDNASPALDDMPVFDAASGAANSNAAAAAPQTAASAALGQGAGGQSATPQGSPQQRPFTANTSSVPTAPGASATPAVPDRNSAAPAGENADNTLSQGTDMMTHEQAGLGSDPAPVESADRVPSDMPPVITGDTTTLAWRGQDRLELQFSVDSWVEVEHRGGAETHRNLLLAGDLLVIDGTAPFAILLGTASGVEVRLNGRVMDISANVRSDDTARLSLGM